MKSAATTVALLRFHLGRLGWPGALGAALGVFALAFYFSGVRETEVRLAQVKADISELRAGRSASMDSVFSREEQIAEFRRFFPHLATLPDLLTTIHRAAETRGVALDSAEYKEMREKGSPLVRYQVSLPLRGSYPQIRAWLADVMNDIPSAVLEDFNLKRDNIGNATLDARARLSLYFEAR